MRLSAASLTSQQASQAALDASIWLRGCRTDEHASIRRGPCASRHVSRGDRVDWVDRADATEVGD